MRKQTSNEWGVLSHAIRRAKERKAAQRFTAITLPTSQLSSAGQSNKRGDDMASTRRGKTDEALKGFDALGGEEVVVASKFWTPDEIGEMLIGVYAGKRTDGKYGPVAKIQTVDGELVPVGLSKQLEDLLPPTHVGKPVAIQYAGKRSTGKQNPMKEYRVKVLDAETWERILDDDLPF